MTLAAPTATPERFVQFGSEAKNMNAPKWILLGAVIVTVQVSACSGDDDNGAGGTGGTTTSGGSAGRGGASGRAGSGARAGSAGLGAGGQAEEGGTGATAGRGGNAGRGAGGTATAGGGGTATAGRGGGNGEAGSGENAGMGGASGEGGAGGAVAELTDAEILHVASTANQGEVSEGQIAVTRATATPVHDFAQMMVNDHTAANADVMAVSTSTGIVPASNAVSQKLATESQQETTALDGASASAFDALYINAQIKDHEDVLDLLNGTLIPEAQNAEVRALLSSMKSAVEGHLTAAQQVRDGL